MMVRLVELAHGISGDKGDKALIGLVSSEKEYYDIIDDQVTEERVAEHFSGMCNDGVDKYRLPNINGFNFVLHGALGGGGQRSLQEDFIGKTYAAALMRMKVDLEGYDISSKIHSQNQI